MQLNVIINYLDKPIPPVCVPLVKESRRSLRKVLGVFNLLLCERRTEDDLPCPYYHSKYTYFYIVIYFVVIMCIIMSLYIIHVNPSCNENHNHKYKYIYRTHACYFTSYAMSFLSFHNRYGYRCINF